MVACGLLLLVLTAGCRPLYIPPVPESADAPTHARLGSDSELSWSPVSGRLELRVLVAGVEEPGWLAVQWLAPNGTEVASQSAWLAPSADGSPAGHLFVSPLDVDLGAGEWRALVSWQGFLLRQFRAEVPARDEGE